MAAQSIRYKVLGPGNVDLMRDLSALFAEAFGEPQTYPADRPSRIYLERLLGDEQFVVLVALKDGVVVGGLAGYQLPKFEQERSEIFIYDLAVRSPPACWRR